MLVPRKQLRQQIREERAIEVIRNLPEWFHVRLETLAAATGQSVEDITTQVNMLGAVWMTKHVGLDRIQ